MDAKMVGLGASAFIVNVASFSGNRLFFVCSGAIIECEDDAKGSYVSTILTTASLLMCSTCYIPSLVDSNTIPNDIKVEVRNEDGTVFEGHVIAWDFHYNIAFVKIKSNAMQPSLKFRNLEDAVGVDTFGSNFIFQLRSHSDLFHINFGDMVVMLGRHYLPPFELAITPGTFSFNFDRDLDCRELFMANCKIAKCCVGGPLLNRHGELIGVAFRGDKQTPFLPINIVYKCLEHLKKYGKFCRPYVGVDMYNLCAETVGNLEKFLLKFPDIFKGVCVKSVIEESPADLAGILEHDVIIGCNGSSVESYLQFMEMIFDKVGESMDLLVLRTSSGARLNLSLVVEETSPGDFYIWPIRQGARHWRGKPLARCCGIVSPDRDAPSINGSG